MKKFILIALIGLVSFEIMAQSPKATTENDFLKITYCQPSKKGREIFGGLVPFNQVWRTGANEATEITVKQDITIGGKSIKKGTYSLFTIPTATDWTLILNSELKQWGSYGYDKVKDKNVLEAKSTSSSTDASQEVFTITAGPASIDLAWDKTKVSFAVK